MSSAPPPLVLASRSPQRRAILTQLRIPFVVRAVDVTELSEGEPGELVEANARRKACAGAAADVSADSADPRQWVLGVDTVVVLDADILGKPADAVHAGETLARLAGRTHRVFSGVAVSRAGVLESLHEVTTVTFRSLPADALERYVASEEWRGRAGGYAIQGLGAALVRRIEGDYLNVVGLPAGALLDRWPELGLGGA
ncbi:MAG TPA: Maf family protein [Solirubrobacteraceae bacterium]|nr:Maf family protein [Solirubrobacteraceae bacterium]